jgi:hypothetical protein
MMTGSRRDDQGATTVLVALLLSGVMVGLLALGSTTGNLVWERRQLQNSADATSLKLAQTCALKLSDCDAGAAAASLEALGDLNANDASQALDGAGRSDTVLGQCGRVPGAPNMPLCDSGNPSMPAADIADLRQCPPLPTWLQGNAIKYVETYTRSESADGPFVRFLFADGQTAVHSCARAAWGVPTNAAVLPFTLSDCEWDDATNSGTVYGVETALPLKYKDKTYCGGVVGRDYDGGFGWLLHGSGMCEVEVDKNSWVEGDQGMGKGTDCMHLLPVGATILIPIFDCYSQTKVLPCVTSDKPHGVYHIKAYGAFTITGYKLPSKTETSGVGSTAMSRCSSDFANGKHCLFGKFVKALVQEAEIDPDPTAEDFGAQVVKMAG